MPADNLLGEEGEGFTNFMRTLDNGRVGIAALSLGIAEGAFEQSLRYATLRKQFGQVSRVYPARRRRATRKPGYGYSSRMPFRSP